ncbi:MAG TPA: hypothetical protein VFE62_08095 [Gemmataceae bacterium]|nr:hypothetical protein [Gemmataceae bacterium]
MARKKYARPTPKQFIETWQTSASTTEVAEKLRMNTRQVRVRACRYRRRGVPLKLFAWPDPPDWDELADYAASLVPGEDKTTSESAGI